MAKENSGQGSAQGGTTASDPMAAARAAKGKQRTNGKVLSAEEQFALQNVRLAGRACKMAAKRIQDQKPVEPKILEACSALAGSMSNLLYT